MVWHGYLFAWKTDNHHEITKTIVLRIGSPGGQNLRESFAIHVPHSAKLAIWRKTQTLGKHIIYKHG